MFSDRKLFWTWSTKTTELIAVWMTRLVCRPSASSHIVFLRRFRKPSWSRIMWHKCSRTMDLQRSGQEVYPLMTSSLCSLHSTKPGFIFHRGHRSLLFNYVVNVVVDYNPHKHITNCHCHMQLVPTKNFEPTLNSLSCRRVHLVDSSWRSSSPPHRFQTCVFGGYSVHWSSTGRSWCRNSVFSERFRRLTLPGCVAELLSAFLTQLKSWTGLEPGNVKGALTFDVPQTEHPLSQCRIGACRRQ